MSQVHPSLLLGSGDIWKGVRCALGGGYQHIHQGESSKATGSIISQSRPLGLLLALGSRVKPGLARGRTGTRRGASWSSTSRWSVVILQLWSNISELPQDEGYSSYNNDHVTLNCVSILILPLWSSASTIYSGSCEEDNGKGIVHLGGWGTYSRANTFRQGQGGNCFFLFKCS